MTGWTSMLAQEDGGWGNLLYLLVVLVLPALSQFGTWIRKRYGNESPEDAPPGAEAPPMPPPKRIVRPTARPAAGPAAPRARKPRPPVPPARPVIKPPPKPVPTKVAAPPRKAVRRARPAHTEPILAAIVESAETAARKRSSKRRATPAERGKRDSTMQRLIRESEAAGTRAKTAQSAQRLLPARFDAKSMRAAIILSEIIQPPVSLRDESF